MLHLIVLSFLLRFDISDFSFGREVVPEAHSDPISENRGDTDDKDLIGPGVGRYPTDDNEQNIDAPVDAAIDERFQ